MSMILFMPWCRIDRAYSAGEIEVFPFDEGKPIGGIEESAQPVVRKILKLHKTIEGKPVARAGLVRFSGRSLIDELSNQEQEVAHDLIALACFSGLAERQYFNSLGPYCNSDCFSLVVQKFTNADFTAITTRRRDGRTLSGWPIDKIAITTPTHCHPIQSVGLDEALLNALVARRAQLKNEEWGVWQNAISCFNQANTDSDNVRPQVEWVLLCSAFEHLLGAESHARDVAAKFSSAISPKASKHAASAARRSQRLRDEGQPLRFEWMREFYRVRGDFAHGRLETKQPLVWSALEHLVLATIAFPLVVKSLLSGMGAYHLTEDDIAYIGAFESLADTPGFLESPEDMKHSGDSHWVRLVKERKRENLWGRINEEVFGKLNAGNETASEGSGSEGNE